MKPNEEDPPSQDGCAQMACLSSTVEEMHSLAAAHGSNLLLTTLAASAKPHYVADSRRHPYRKARR